MNKAVGGEKVAGKKLKAKSGWNDYKGKSGNGTDEFGFSALPGGIGSASGSFANVGSHGFWWSASEGKKEVPVAALPHQHQATVPLQCQAALPSIMACPVPEETYLSIRHKSQPSYNAYFWGMHYYDEYAYRDNYVKPVLFSVRCIKDYP